MVTIPSGNNTCQAFVTNIKTSMKLGVNYLKIVVFLFLTLTYLNYLHQVAVFLVLTL
jgi:hypothetical protein